jgi:hypothetical protein
MDEEKIKKRIEREAKNIPHIIPAYRIMEQVTGVGFIEDYINDILPVIADDIQSAIESPEKKNYSTTEIPTMFDVPGMTNQRAQLYIYFHLLLALKKAKYHPKINVKGANPRTQRVYIHVVWFSTEDIEMEKYMNKFVQAHSMDPAVRNGTDEDLGEQSKPIQRRRRRKL